MWRMSTAPPIACRRSWQGDCGGSKGNGTGAAIGCTACDGDIFRLVPPPIPSPASGGGLGWGVPLLPSGVCGLPDAAPRRRLRINAARGRAAQKSAPSPQPFCDAPLDCLVYVLLCDAGALCDPERMVAAFDDIQFGGGCNGAMIGCSSAGAPNASREPWTNSIGAPTPGRCAARSRSGLPGG